MTTASREPTTPLQGGPPSTPSTPSTRTQLSTLLRGTDRAQFERWLLDLTQIPTAAGHEHRVVAWIERFVADHPNIVLEQDAAGNLVLSLASPAETIAEGPGLSERAASNIQYLQQVAAQKLAAIPGKLSNAFAREAGGKEHTKDAAAAAAHAAAEALHALAASLSQGSAQPAAAPGVQRPLYITAHLDHPAFVVERVIAPTMVELSFRGGVMSEYFPGARIVLHGRLDVEGEGASDIEKPAFTKGTITGPSEAPDQRFKRYICELDGKANMLTWVKPGDVGVWDVGPARIEGNKAYTLACDDLSAAAAALSTMHVLARAAATDPKFAQQVSHVRLLFTRAEEIGFVGAIAACRLGTMEEHARVIALENSRSFAESPIHGGVIVRVGDRVSVFSPTLVDAVAQRAQDIAGGASTVTASQKLSELPTWRWQRKLMAGGACEASVFCAFGYEAMCVCLPLGNYHNMSRLDEAQAGTLTRYEVGPECIGLDDYHAMIELLLACALGLPERSPFMGRLDDLWGKLSGVLSERA
jgi:putative aminopeptidase FrvX